MRTLHPAARNRTLRPAARNRKLRPENSPKLMYMVFLAAAPVLLAVTLAALSNQTTFGSPKILKFQDGAAAAVSLQFDDSMISQIDNAVPLLNSRGIRATFFVITGSWQYTQRRHAWEVDLPKAGHEIGNHTVHHKGATTVEGVAQEIGGCSDYLATVFGSKPRLVSFATPGGVPWSFTPQQLDPIFRQYHLVVAEHRNFFDEKTTDPVTFIQKALDTGTWTNVAMHGTGGEWLSTSLPNLTRLLDFMVSNRNRLWIAPEIEVYKYVQERDAANPPVLSSNGPDRFTVEISCDPSKLAFNDLPVEALYDQPLTVEVAVPASWKSFQVRQGMKAVQYAVESTQASHVARFQVLPNLPPAIVSRI
jgi:peptidoglycan/xylan/chitin deacetylase (PgdA/CDA1 family)